MKYKQLSPKSARLILSSNSTNKQHIRCSLCDLLLKTSSTYRYLLMGKSIDEKMIINNSKSITYAECCKKYLNDIYQPEKLNMICPKCSHNLENIHSLHLNAEELSKNMRRTLHKTKRLNRIRSSNMNDITIIGIKEEPSIIQSSTESIVSKKNYIHQTNDKINHFQPSQYRSNISSMNSAFVSVQTSNDYEYRQNYSYNHPINNTSIPYSQFLIESPTSSASSYQQSQQNNSNNEQLTIGIDDDRSLSPCINDDENESKTTRITRRQYNFLIKLPDQQSLNAFIEKSSSESNSRWTWRRTSANSRGYKIYYVCNYSMRRHYQPCPAAMYALFNPEGSISIYSHGQHQHIPKTHQLPSTITDETKDEIYRCLQTDMSASDIREHLIRLKLSFGDTKKLNNFIKYHKEILRFGAVTNVRLNGTAYRQPQYWAIRRTSPTNVNTTTL